MVVSDVQSPPSWRTIWFRPQATIKAISERPTTPAVPFLAALAGVVSILGFGFGGPWQAIVVAALLGPVLGIARLYIDGALTWLFGRVLGGRASQSTLRAALAWSSAPMVVALFISLASFLVFGQEFAQQINSDAIENPFVTGVAIVFALLTLWSVFLLVRTVGAVQGFGIFRSLANALLPLIVVFATALAFRFLAFQPFSIPAGSMEPTLLIGDNFFVNKFSYGWSRYSFPLDAGFAGRVMGAAPKRGDLVVFKLPRDNATDYVKRIIGLPGDEIEMVDGVLHINGAVVPKEPAGEFSPNGRVHAIPVYEETLSDGVRYAVLDEEQNGPFDSIGPYSVPEGHYFVLGDNRDNSSDSRSLFEVGFIPAENLVGRVSIIYRSVDPSDGSMRWDRTFLVPR